VGPVEDAIGEAVLEIAEGRRVLKIAKVGIVERALKLRIVHNQLEGGIAGCCGEDGSCFEQSVVDGVSEVGALDALHGCLDGGGVEEVALDDFCCRRREAMMRPVEPC
jgi:hypothetical protein